MVISPEFLLTEVMVSGVAADALTILSSNSAKAGLMKTVRLKAHVTCKSRRGWDLYQFPEITGGDATEARLALDKLVKQSAVSDEEHELLRNVIKIAEHSSAI